MRRSGGAVTLCAVLIALLLWGGATAGAHNDDCLLAVHAGGIQQHLVCE